MSWPEYVMWAVVAGIGFPAAFRNRTALALCVSWLVGEASWMATGDNLPLMLYFILDYCVLLVIITKPEPVDMSPYRSLLDQLKALWLERCRGDGVVAFIFPVMWLAYVADIGDYYRWWTLWGLVQIQFFAVGWDMVCSWYERRREKPAMRDRPGIFRLGLAGHG